jgi:methenyltetrahydromethanopterin cyclohydrolase
VPTFYPTTDDHLYAVGDAAATWGIGDGAFIDGALLDKNVCIGNNARIVASEAPSPDCDFGEVLVRTESPAFEKMPAFQKAGDFR